MTHKRITRRMKTKTAMLTWADALESGDFNQARGHLKIDGGHCCLGVLCEITDDAPSWSGSYEFPPEALEVRIGIGHDFVKHLARLNDSYTSFPSIAREIREVAKSL